MDVSVKKMILISIASIAGLLLLLVLGWLVYFKLQFAVYQDDQYKFSIKYPKAWKVLSHPKPDVAVVFFRPKDTAMDVLQENFNVTVQPLTEQDLTLTAFNTTVKKQLSAVFGKNIHFVEDRPIRWGWRVGHKIAVEAPVPDHLKMVNAWVLRSADAYILTFLGDLNKYPQESIYIDEMIRSFSLR